MSLMCGCLALACSWSLRPSHVSLGERAWAGHLCSTSSWTPLSFVFRILGAALEEGGAMVGARMANKSSQFVQHHILGDTGAPDLAWIFNLGPFGCLGQSPCFDQINSYMLFLLCLGSVEQIFGGASICVVYKLGCLGTRRGDSRPCLPRSAFTCKVGLVLFRWSNGCPLSFVWSPACSSSDVADITGKTWGLDLCGAHLGQAMC